MMKQSISRRQACETGNSSDYIQKESSFWQVKTNPPIREHAQWLSSLRKGGLSRNKKSLGKLEKVAFPSQHPMSDPAMMKGRKS